MTLPAQTIVGWRKDGRPIRVIAGGDNTASASPSPQAQASPSTVSVGGFNFTAPTGNGSGNTNPDLYGLGAWRDQSIDVSGFPSSIVALLSKNGIDTSKPVKAQDIAQALENIQDPQAVAQLQQILYWSGMYGNSVKLSDLTLGQWSKDDTNALASAITTAGRSASALGTYLTTAANTGYAQGMINQASGLGSTPITEPPVAEEDAALRTAAHTLLGREPSQSDLAGFRAYYDQVYAAGQKDALKLQAQQQQTASQSSATQLGGALGRLGRGFTDANQAPPPTVTGLPASQQRNPDFASQPALFSPANPALGQFQAQQQQDASLVNSLGQADTPVLRSAPSVSTAAEDYLRQAEAPAVGQQNVATRYATLLNILTGTGH